MTHTTERTPADSGTSPRRDARPPTRRRRRVRPHRIALYVVAVLAAVVMAGPVVWMLTTSLKTSGDALAVPPELVPDPVEWSNYADVFREVPFARYMLNSFIVASVVTVVALLLHSMAGYSLARLRYPGRNLIFVGILATLMVPFTVILIPLTVIVRDLGWINSYAGLIVPMIPNAFGIFLLRQFYLSIPRGLEEAAQVDGASLWRVYWTIILPLSRPVLAALGIFFFLANWNNFLWPLVIAPSEENWVVQIGVQRFSGLRSDDFGLQMAASTIAAAPTLILFVVLQRRLIEGIKMTGLKG
jgi:multiple sugar transport system permease protein